MRKHILTIIAGILFLTGVSLLLYPNISNYWNTIHQNRITADYADRVEKMDEQEKDQILKEADQYNQMLSADAGRFIPTQEKSNWYDSLLDADGRGMMGYITIPKIQCKLSVYHGTEDSVLQMGIGHLEGSSLPVGGSGTHCVLVGHRGLPSAKLFTDLDELEEGDVFLLHVYDQVLTYEVDQIRIVQPEDYGLLEIEEGEDLCTLLTCTPYGINTQRLLVRGHRIQNQTGENVRVTADAVKLSTELVAAWIAVPLLLISFLIRSKKKRRRG